VLERVRNNAGIKLLSLALAILAWWYLRFAANPSIAAHFDQQLSVPIVTTGLRSDAIARYTDKQAVITIVSPRDSTTPVRPDDVRAVLNLGGRGPGVYSIPVTIIGPRLEVKTVAPASVTLQIALVDARRAAVGVRYTGDPRGVVAQSLQITPDRALVRGAADDLARMAGVRVDVAFPGAPQELDAMYKPSPIDLRGEEVPGLQVAPNYVRVRAKFVTAQHGA